MGNQGLSAIILNRDIPGLKVLSFSKFCDVDLGNNAITWVGLKYMPDAGF